MANLKGYQIYKEPAALAYFYVSSYLYKNPVLLRL